MFCLSVSLLHCSVKFQPPSFFLAVSLPLSNNHIPHSTFLHFIPLCILLHSDTTSLSSSSHCPLPLLYNCIALPTFITFYPSLQSLSSATEPSPALNHFLPSVFLLLLDIKLSSYIVHSSLVLILKPKSRVFSKIIDGSLCSSPLMLRPENLQSPCTFLQQRRNLS